MGSVLSPNGVYRYQLDRYLGSGNTCTWIMLNPSTADATINDPTIRRCLRFTSDWGYGHLIVVNLYPFRATDPKDLITWLCHVRPADLGAVLDENERHIRAAASDADLCIAAWGHSGQRIGDVGRLRYLLRESPLYVLGLTKKGYPRHPLYVRADTEPKRWHPEGE